VLTSGAGVTSADVMGAASMMSETRWGAGLDALEFTVVLGFLALLFGGTLFTVKPLLFLWFAQQFTVSKAEEKLLS